MGKFIRIKTLINISRYQDFSLIKSKLDLLNEED